MDEPINIHSTQTDEIKDELSSLKGHVIQSLQKIAPNVVSRWEKTQPPNMGPGLPLEGGL